MGLELLFLTMTLQFNLPHGLLASICYTESKYDVSAIHHDDGSGDSLGVCQIKLSTAQWMGFKGTSKELMEPSQNIYYAAKYLKHQLIRYHDISKATISYNQGQAKGLTTTKYQRKVFKYWRMHYK